MYIPTLTKLTSQVFDFLNSLTVICAMVPWAVICATYLRFRQAVKRQRMTRAIPPKAVSPIQPYLAVYGLAWSVLISCPPQKFR
jgi:amino acid permease